MTTPVPSGGHPGTAVGLWLRKLIIRTTSVPLMTLLQSVSPQIIGGVGGVHGVGAGVGTGVGVTTGVRVGLGVTTK